MNLPRIIYGFKNYTEFHVGDLNILISVPHDGQMRPENITNRESNKIKNDMNTFKIGISLRKYLKELFAMDKAANIPFMVVNNLHRIKMDPNRNSEHCCSNLFEDSLKAYNDYHNFIESFFVNEFLGASKSLFKHGLLIDIHGHNHPENWIELGYLISGNDLNRNNFHASNTSIYTLSTISQFPFDDIVRGSVSLGGIMERAFNLNVIPSPKNRCPTGANYYTGGYITDRHGNRGFNMSSNLNAIQIELPSSMRDKDAIESSAKMLAICIYEFYKIHDF